MIKPIRNNFEKTFEDEINILQEKYENFLKPLQDEWEKHVNEWIPKEKEQRNKVKI